MRTHRGHTLIELLLALGVIAGMLLAALAAFSGGLEAARAQDARTRLLGSFLHATGRATLSGYRTVLCASRDGLACSGSVDWSGGWLVFQDTDGDGELGATEYRVEQVPALAGAVRLHSTSGRSRIAVLGNGGTVGSNVTFTLCDGRGPAKARSLILSNQGRLREAPADAEAAAATCAH
jgi:type IV fimbrial biogenesis protein FimT